MAERSERNSRHRASGHTSDGGRLVAERIGEHSVLVIPPTKEDS